MLRSIEAVVESVRARASDWRQIGIVTSREVGWGSCCPGPLLALINPRDWR
jgi:hypothetical protein